MTTVQPGSRRAPLPEVAPDWFDRALAAAPELRSVDVEGARIAYRAWGPAGAPGVVLVHGGAAHSGWWDHVAPELTGHRVIAPDMSGYGDSGRRETYGMAQWARELAAVAAAERLDRAVVVGHSKGGWTAITAGAEHADRFSAVVAIDSPIHTEPPDESWLRRRRRPHHVYPQEELAVERFATLPPQDVVLPYVRRHIAQNSLRAVEGGWTWKFDPRTFAQVDDQRGLLAALDVPFALLRCEHGLVSEEMAEQMTGLVDGRSLLVSLPDSGHHPMLDHPRALVAVLRTLLAVEGAR
jgi:pimeloyl-ACP methyl ester carboxylesterase